MTTGFTCTRKVSVSCLDLDLYIAGTIFAMELVTLPTADENAVTESAATTVSSSLFHV